MLLNIIQQVMTSCLLGTPLKLHSYWQLCSVNTRLLIIKTCGCDERASSSYVIYFNGISLKNLKKKPQKKSQPIVKAVRTESKQFQIDQSIYFLSTVMFNVLFSF